MKTPMYGVLLIVAAVLVAGCGGSESTAETTAVAAEVAPPPGPVTPAPVEDLAERLQAAGLPAQPTYLHDGKSKMSISGVEITYFADPAEAAREGAGVEGVAANHPTKMLALSHGQFLVWAANESALTPREEAAFAKIAAAVEKLS
jgi:hypothetical protein